MLLDAFVTVRSVTRDMEHLLSPHQTVVVNSKGAVALYGLAVDKTIIGILSL